MEALRHPALDSLLRELQSHPVNTNTFFERFKNERLDDQRLRTFIVQYHYFCKHFVKVLEGLLFRTPLDEIEMRIGLTKTLYSELGNGDPEQAHITLLNNFARTLGLDEALLNRTIPTSGVTSYLDTLQNLFIQSDYLTALGAELAVEVTAASEFQYLYPGLQRYPMIREEDLHFFKIHVEEEVCHSTWLLDTVQRTARSDQDLDAVASGARQTAQAWHQFWLEMYREVFGPGEGGPRESPAPAAAQS